MVTKPSLTTPNAAAFTELAAANFTYEWERGPQQVRTMKDAENGGLNCVAFNHLLLGRLFGVVLPKELHGNEMLLDLNGPGRILRPVANFRLAQPGDVVFLGLERRPDAQRRFSPQYDNDGFITNSQRSGFRHIVTVTNEIDPTTGESRVMDISRDGGIRTATLAEVMDVEDRCQSYGIGRLVVTDEYNIPMGEAA